MNILAQMTFTKVAEVIALYSSLKALALLACAAVDATTSRTFHRFLVTVFTSCTRMALAIATSIRSETSALKGQA